MSRIIGGTGKGRRLKTAAGERARPTGARVRQSLFDILAPVVPGCRFLDAFAGNGSVGLEALSRGAAKVVLVDRDAAAVQAAQENARALGHAGGEVRVFRQDARTAIGDADTLVKNLDSEAGRIAPKARESLDQLRATLERADRSMQTLDATLKSTDDTRVDLARPLTEMSQTLAVLRNLVDYIQTHPEAIVLGKPTGKEKK